MIGFVAQSANKKKKKEQNYGIAVLIENNKGTGPFSISLSFYIFSVKFKENKGKEKYLGIADDNYMVLALFEEFVKK